MTVMVFGPAGSPNVRGSLLGLVEKGVDHEAVDVLPPFKDPAHVVRNPFGHVPVLDHDGFVLYETQAILRYVDRAFAGPSLQPADRHEAARMDQILGIIDCYLFPSWTGAIGFERLIAPHFFGRESDLDCIAAALPMAKTCAATLEALIATPYLTGDTYSLADIRLLPHFAWFRQTHEGEAILSDKPNLRGWFGRVSVRPAVRALAADVRAA